MPTVQTETEPATPTKPPPTLTAYEEMSLRDSALTPTLPAAVTVEPTPTTAATLEFAVPMSTPPATPTKPPPIPPAMVSDLNLSTADTLTEASESSVEPPTT